MKATLSNNISDVKATLLNNSDRIRSVARDLEKARGDARDCAGELPMNRTRFRGRGAENERQVDFGVLGVLRIFLRDAFRSARIILYACYDVPQRSAHLRGRVTIPARETNKKKVRKTT